MGPKTASLSRGGARILPGIRQYVHGMCHRNPPRCVRQDPRRTYPAVGSSIVRTYDPREMVIVPRSIAMP